LTLRHRHARFDWSHENHRYACQQFVIFLVWLIFAAPYQTNRKWNLKLYTHKISFRSQTQMLKSTRGTLHNSIKSTETSSSKHTIIYSPTKVKHHLTCFNNIFSNNELISNRFACHPSMAKTTVMHANSLSSFWYG
jgi:hypothetical protein